MTNTDFDIDSPKEVPLGSCIHCGGNIWQSDYLGKLIEEPIYRCKRCKELNTKSELIPF